MAEKRIIELEVQDNTKSLKAQLKEAQNEVAALADKFGATSQQAVEAAKRAAELKDQIGDAKALTDAFNPDAKFKSLSASLTGVAGGFSAVTGAMGLIGVESEDVQKAMLKVQSAMALSQGLQSLGEARDSFKQLGAVVKNVFTNMTTAGKAFAVTGIGLLVTGIGLLIANADRLKETFGGVTEAQKDLVEAQKAGAKAMADATMSVNEVDIAFRQAKEGVISKEQALKVYNEKLGATLGTTDNYNLAEKTFRDNTGKYIKAVQARAIAQALASKAAEELAKAETANLENQVGTVEGLVGMAETYFTNGLGDMSVYEDKAAQMQAEGVARAKKNAQERYNQLNKLAEQYLTDALEIESELNTTKAKVEKASTKKSKTEAENKRKAEQEATEKAHEKSLEDLKKHNEQLLNEEEANAEAIRRAKMSARDLELSDIQDEYFNKIETAKQLGEEGNDLVIKLEKEKEEKRKEIIKKYDDLEKAKREQQQQLMLDLEEKSNNEFITRQELMISLLDEGLNKEIAIRKLAYDQEQIDLQNKLDNQLISEEQFQALSKKNYKNYQEGITADTIAYNQKQIEADKAKLEQKQAIEQQGMDLALQGVGLLKQVFSKSKAVQKGAVLVESAVGIAKMIQANQIANIGALATPQAIASSGAAAAPVIAMNNISTGIGIAANIAATAKALKEIGAGGSASAPSTAGGGGGAAGGGGGAMQAPNFNVVGNNGINQLAQLQQQPVKAYVVGAEVTSQQALDRNRISTGQL